MIEDVNRALLPHLAAFKAMLCTANVCDGAERGNVVHSFVWSRFDEMLWMSCSSIVLILVLCRLDPDGKGYRQ